MFIEGEPNKHLQVAREDGARVRFNRDVPHDHAGKQAYSSGPYNGVFSYGTLFFFGFDSDIQTADGWHYLFPFRRTAKIEQKQTALAGYSDPQGRRYEMVRNDDGDLLSITTPGGRWLHFAPAQRSLKRSHSLRESICQFSRRRGRGRRFCR